ncbi:conserved hypothetical protein [Nannizzia gypsea CBS 118893]|uniref:G-protein coupled receptors family 2 profile 2 domain-containing protein n=1 Tax=Arthroderma gypseum (strain ATCC MYA-4604 / CBS 118893) TaxID=535722 RepID=E4V0K5_ARTGP|nr:conserved hypothetical protein [Nannizzia gypsea CBS 118893]EFR03142.1 conserved hypothetical protein [Nannizzia gypsea CBS 118893]
MAAILHPKKNPYQGLCPSPFLQENLFPPRGGYIEGRFCTSQYTTVSCCLPCPVGDWKYSPGFLKKTEVTNWLAVAAFIANALLLVSYAVLPVKVTHRHYLNVCLILGIMSFQMAFIVPLASKPQQCYNGITPNDMFSELSCSWSGAFVLFGAWTSITWSFFRTLSLHLQICWNLVLGQRFFLGTLALGWAIPPMGITIGLVLTGVSYRFGNVCHINHDHSLADFWGPILAISGASLLIHLITLLYCMQVYVRSVFEEKPPTDTSSAFPSYTGSVTTLTYRQTFKRVKHVVKMQWRGIAVVLVVMTYAVFFTLVFLDLDRAVDKTPDNISRAYPWLVCIALTNGDVGKCLEEHNLGGPSEGLVFTVLILLPFCGFWSVLLLGRLSIITGWVHFVRGKFRQPQEFPPRGITPNKDYAMLGSSSRYNNTKSPDPLLSKSRQSDLSMTTFKVSGAKESEDCIRDEIKYPNPAMSFSRPRPPSASRTEPAVRDWDPQSTFAPSASTRSRGYPYYPDGRYSDRNV